MADSTLGAIRTKVRRLTRSPSPSQITDAQIDEYVNTFILYDFPESLRLFSLRTTLTFYTQPFVDVYGTSSTPANDPLFNFKNKYVAVHPPVYLAGVPGFFTQNRNEFYNNWPQTNSIADTQLRGSGITGPYVGTLATGTGAPVMKNNVIFTTVNASGVAMVLVDYPSATLNEIGFLGLPNQPQTTAVLYGQVNYVTGAFTCTFPVAVPALEVIWSETIPYQPAKPIGMLYFDNEFTIRPIPDMAYSVSIEVDARPTELLLVGDIPYEEQWWQYVAIGAAIKIFQDRMDMDSVNMIASEFQRQEDFVGRTSLVQYANQRSQTIYTQGKNYGSGWFLSGWPY